MPMKDFKLKSKATALYNKLQREGVQASIGEQEYKRIGMKPRKLYTVRWQGPAVNPRRVKLPSKWTNAKVRVDAKGRVQIGLAKNPFLGKGGTLARGVKSVTKNPGGLRRVIAEYKHQRKGGTPRAAAVKRAIRSTRKNSGKRKR